jgi:hypothetical protein
VGTEAMAILLEISSLELDAATLVEAKERQDEAENTELAVDIVLLLCVCGAERGVEGAGESLLAHAVRLLVVQLAAAVLGLAAAGWVGRSVGALVVAVGGGDDDAEAALVLAIVCFAMLACGV